ncbi:MAG: multidrug efflux MFS transporter [Acidimicrobiales bacterium]|nr:multidrug efflux MFS transporter [Acidimicrobiales bacterium]
MEQAIDDAPPAARLLGRTVEYKYIVAIAFVLGLFMDILDTTIVNVALPTLATEFKADTNTIEWVVTGYLLSLALWIPASGWLGDRFGTKRIFVFALFTFTAASALCGAAWSIESLIVFRVLQGVGGGMLTPVGTAMLYRAFPPIERPRASSILAMVTVVAPALGPILGGLLVEKASWRWIFYVNLPLGVLGLAFAVIYLREHTEPAAGRFDVAGFLLSGLGLAALLYGLAEGPVRGWMDAIVVVSLAFAVVMFIALIKVELAKTNPLLDLRLLADRSFRTPNLVSFASFGAMLGLLFLLPQFLQGPRQLSPFQSGLTTFPQAVGMFVTARFIGGYLYPRIGPRRLIMFGMAANAVITLAFVKVGLDTSEWTIRALMFGRGLTIGFGFIPLQAAAFARIRPESTGRASALFQAQRQAGAAVGVAVLATILLERRDALVGDLTGAQAVPQLVAAYHDAFLGSVVLAALGFVAASFIKDVDAAPTMRRIPPKG